VLIAQTMVYADTRRDFWRFASTFPRFLGSAVILGLALKSAFNPSGVTRIMLLAAVLVKLAGEIASIKVANPNSERWTQLRRTAALQYGPLRQILAARVFLGLLGGVFLPFAMVVGALAPGFALVICGLCFGAELVERFLFFTSVAPDKMPGHL
jgi:DMSO reductase anchor subunit